MMHTCEIPAQEVSQYISGAAGPVKEISCIPYSISRGRVADEYDAVGRIGIKSELKS